MKIFAMDTYFHHALGSYDLLARCGMLKDLGYDANYLTLFRERDWDYLEKLEETERRYELPVEAVFVGTKPEDSDRWQRIRKALLPALPKGTALEIAIELGDSRKTVAEADTRKLIADQLRETLAIAETTKTPIRIYPHVQFAVARTGEAVDLAEAIQHPLLGVTFSGFHWYSGDAKPLSAVLEKGGSLITGANLCGSRPGGRINGYTIEAVGDGHLDNFIILAELQRIGYTGAVGVQGYSLGGDVYANLRSSLTTLREMTARLKAHPEWAAFHFEPTDHLATMRGPRP